MTDAHLEHLKEYLRAFFKDGFFLVGLKDGDAVDPIMEWDTPMQQSYLERATIDAYIRTWGIPDNVTHEYEEVTFEAEGDWLEDED